MCADKSPDLFSHPAYKLMIADIKSATPTTSATGETEWSLTITHMNDHLGNPIPLSAYGRPDMLLDLKMVWIQGKVKKIEKLDPDSDNLSLVVADDLEDTDKCTVILHDYATVPGGDCEEIKIGSYIGALGRIWTNSAEETVIKVVKIMYLGEKLVHKHLWVEEVRLSKAYLAGLIEPHVDMY